MGWAGYGIYDGDGTMSCHYDFLNFAKVSSDDNEIGNWMSLKGTILPKEKIPILQKNINLVLKKMPKIKLSKTEENWNTKDSPGESNALEWQMLLALFVDNKVVPPKEVYDTGVKATLYLMGEHSDDFNKPGLRRKTLKNFVKKAEKLFKGKTK